VKVGGFALNFDSRFEGIETTERQQPGPAHTETSSSDLHSPAKRQQKHNRQAAAPTASLLLFPARSIEPEICNSV